MHDVRRQVVASLVREGSNSWRRATVGDSWRIRHCEVDYRHRVRAEVLRDATSLSADVAFNFLPHCLRPASNYDATGFRSGISVVRPRRDRGDQSLTPQTFLLYALILFDAAVIDLDDASNAAISAFESFSKSKFAFARSA
jgi:hypothetical protein